MSIVFTDLQYKPLLNYLPLSASAVGSFDIGALRLPGFIIKSTPTIKMTATTARVTPTVAPTGV